MKINKQLSKYWYDQLTKLGAKHTPLEKLIRGTRWWIIGGLTIELEEVVWKFQTEGKFASIDDPSDSKVEQIKEQLELVKVGYKNSELWLAKDCLVVGWDAIWIFDGGWKNHPKVIRETMKHLQLLAENHWEGLVGSPKERLIKAGLKQLL
jgi:hypothetical protein